VNSGPYKYETLTNNGNWTVTIQSVNVTGAFKIYNVSTPIRLSAGKSFTFMVKFVPKSPGNYSGSVSITSTASRISIALSGTGQSGGTLTISPTSFSFGTVGVGTTATKAATLKAGSSSVYIPSATTTNPEFTVSGINLPLTIPAGQSVPVSIQFRPASSGTASAQISIMNNVSSSPTVASASGTGLSASAHTVTLQWSPSKSDVAGYNIYRGTSTGGPYSRLNSGANVSTSFVDASVASGKTYFYVTTAVDSSGGESSKSNEVRAVIPTP
jgi:hypothetical protein